MNIYTPSAYTPISPSTTHPQTPNAPSNAPVGSMACTHTLAVSEESLWQYPHPATYPSAHLQNPNTPSNAPVGSICLWCKGQPSTFDCAPMYKLTPYTHTLTHTQTQSYTDTHTLDHTHTYTHTHTLAHTHT
jgi:hypothetical protein